MKHTIKLFVVLSIIICTVVPRSVATSDDLTARIGVDIGDWKATFYAVDKATNQRIPELKAEFTIDGFGTSHFATPNPLQYSFLRDKAPTPTRSTAEVAYPQAVTSSRTRQSGVGFANWTLVFDIETFTGDTYKDIGGLKFPISSAGVKASLNLTNLQDFSFSEEYPHIFINGTALFQYRPVLGGALPLEKTAFYYNETLRSPTALEVLESDGVIIHDQRLSAALTFLDCTSRHNPAGGELLSPTATIRYVTDDFLTQAYAQTAQFSNGEITAIEISIPFLLAIQANESSWAMWDPDFSILFTNGLANAPSGSPDENSEQLTDVGAIAGGVVGGVAGVALVAFFVALAVSPVLRGKFAGPRRADGPLTLKSLDTPTLEASKGESRKSAQWVATNTPANLKNTL